MRRLVLVLALFAVASCTSDSSLPNPTGKGTIRAINAIHASPNFSFLIEERLVDTVSYKNGSTSREFDDFQYVFNFETAFPGDSSLRRVASVTQKLEANQDYTFVITGAVDNPTILTWEASVREWSGTETVFEARFAHLAESLGDIDVYLAADGVAPVAGEQRGTLSYGDVLPSLDIDEGDYVLTITPAGLPGTITYQSSVSTYISQNAFIIPIYDGDELDTANYNVRIVNAAGGVLTIPDARFSPTTRFFQASLDLLASDIYDDEMVTNLVLPNHAFGDVTGDIDVAIGTTDFTYTAINNPSAIQFEGALTAAAGTHTNFFVIGNDASRFAISFVPDRRSVSNSVRLRVFGAAVNHTNLDLYVVDTGTPIDDDVSRTLLLTYSLQSPTVLLDAGSYDLYVTTVGEKTIVSGPLTVDTALGDAVEVVLFDTVDPATAELRVIPAP